MYITSQTLKAQVLNFWSYYKRNKFDKQEKIINQIKEMRYEDDFIVIYFQKLLNESKNNYENKNTEVGLNKEKYLELGKKAYHKENFDQAIELFEKGYELTNENAFIYFIGKCYFLKKDYENALKYLHSYEENGAIYLPKCYEYLYKVNNKLLNKDVNDHRQSGEKRYNNGNSKYHSPSIKYEKLYYKYYNLYRGIFSDKEESNINREYASPIELNDEEIKDLVSKNKLNDLSEIYDKCSYERKVTILALLYLNGFTNFADKLYKKYKDEYQKECPSLIKTLNNNKKLYIAKSKVRK